MLIITINIALLRSGGINAHHNPINIALLRSGGINVHHNPINIALLRSGATGVDTNGASRGILILSSPRTGSCPLSPDFPQRRSSHRAFPSKCLLGYAWAERHPFHTMVAFFYSLDRF